MEENRIRLEEKMETEESKEKEETDNKEEATEIKDRGDHVEDDDSNLIDFQRVPTQLLKSDMLNSTKNNLEKKVLWYNTLLIHY